MELLKFRVAKLSDLAQGSAGNRLRSYRLNKRQKVGRSNQDGFAISDETSERAIKRPVVAFDDAPLSARKVNS
jgi:hypothetical protein